MIGERLRRCARWEAFAPGSYGARIEPSHNGGRGGTLTNTKRVVACTFKILELKCATHPDMTQGNYMDMMDAIVSLEDIKTKTLARLMVVEVYHRIKGTKRKYAEASIRFTIPESVRSRPK